MESFPSENSGLLRSRREVRGPEVTHGPGRRGRPAPASFQALGGRRWSRPPPAGREVATASNARETPLGRHHGARGTLGRVREPEEGAAKGALRLGRASLGLRWPGRGGERSLNGDDLSGPGASFRGTASPRRARPSEVPGTIPHRRTPGPGGERPGFRGTSARRRPLRPDLFREMGRLELPSPWNLLVFPFIGGESLHLVFQGLRRVERER